MKNLGRLLQNQLFRSTVSGNHGDDFRGRPGRASASGSAIGLSGGSGTSISSRPADGFSWGSVNLSCEQAPPPPAGQTIPSHGRTASRSSGPRCPFGIHDRIGFGSTARHRRLGRRFAEPSADHRRQRLGRQRFPRRTESRHRRDANQLRNQFDLDQCHQRCRAGAIAPRHV